MLVVIDGLDASGKNTQALRLCKRLRTRSKTACLRVHPSDDNLFGTETRRFLCLKGKGAHFASAIFYALDVIRSILLYSWQKYDYVIFVRYLMGTAYLPSPLHIVAYNFFALTVPKPDFMFFLDVEPEEAKKRIEQTRSQLEMFESLEELKRIRRKALSLASTGKWTIIDAGKPMSDIEGEIVSTLEPTPQRPKIQKKRPGLYAGKG
jgi:dTMP kinase